MSLIVKSILKITLVLLFIGCLFKMPYGYYELVRFTGMLIFALLAYDANKHTHNEVLLVIWATSALLINPFFKIALGRVIWNIMDIAWAFMLVITIFTDRPSRQENRGLVK